MDKKGEMIERKGLKIAIMAVLLFLFMVVVIVIIKNAVDRGFQ